jgi:RNA recognition motif-containing protein
MASKRPAEEADDEGDARTVFVGNLPHQTTDLDLIEIFGKQGTVVAETIPHHRDGPHEGKPRGFAFVQMKTGSVLFFFFFFFFVQI